MREGGTVLALILAFAVIGGADVSEARPPSFHPSGSPVSDCNGNGVPDDQETRPHFSTVVLDTNADGARSVALADLDGDGDLDVLSASEDDNTIAWYANLGGGAFGARRILNAGAYGANDAIVVDLDGDGDPDVVSSAKGYPEYVLWHENLDGAGTFGAAKPVGGTQNSRALVAADPDGDGDLDVVAAQFFTNKISWFENAGGPVSFVAEHSIAGVETVDPNSVAVGDLDGDTDPDVVTASQKNGTITWYRNTGGTGSFALAQILDSAVQVPRSVRVADIDGDRDLDVLSASWRDNTVAWYENVDGSGTFGPERLVSAIVSGAQVAIAVDLDNDGDLDVAVAAATGSTAPGDNSTCCGPTGIPWCSDDECPLTICEFDGFCCEVTWDQVCGNYAKADPDCSVACGGGAGRLVWFENLDGAGSFGPSNLIAIGEGAFDVASGDLDGDGSIDLVSAAYVDDTLLVHLNLIDDCNGNDVPDGCDIDSGAETDADCNELPDSCEADGGAAADCNGNGSADACDLLPGGPSLDCAGDGVPDECEPDCDANGTADSCDVANGAPDANANGVPDPCDPDCNGNGVPDDLDVSVGGMPDCNGNLVPDGCESDCDGNGVADACDTEVVFIMHVISTTALSFSWSDVLATDIDGDGDNDIVFANGTDRVSWHENLDGYGSFGPQRLISASQDDPASVFAADVDGDADIDVLALSDVGTLAWYENLDGQGSFGLAQFIANGSQNVVARDVDGDQDLDVVSGSAGGTKVMLHKNLDGNGQFWSEELAVNEPGRSFILDDLDGDGDPDLALGNISKIGWCDNLDGNGTFGPVRPLVIPDLGQAPSVEAVFVSDLDGDGAPDIVSHTTQSIAWYRNLGPAGFDLPRVIAAEFKTRSLFVADLDGDGDDDVIFGSTGISIVGYWSQAAWIENLGSGVFGQERALPLDTPPKTVVLSAADLDGDGDIDVVGLLDYVGSNDPVVWWENLGNDCNGNGAPDGCEADCDADGLIDSCALASGVAVDCNANDLPDECDTGCSVACDADGDRCQDPIDLEPMNPVVCADTDLDGCDDCAGGTFAPWADGTDIDADGSCSAGDCSDTDGAAWATPSDTGPLILSSAGGGTLFGWQPPASPGGVTVHYDTLRSGSPSDFFGSTACVESDGADLTSVDPSLPDPGQVSFYLVRVENGCPGPGNMGSASDGTPRAGSACP